MFTDQLGCYAAQLTAAYATGQIGGQPTRGDILGLPAFADHRDLRPGVLGEWGCTESGDRIYTLGVGGEGKIMAVAAGDLFKILGVKEDIRIIDVSRFNSHSLQICWRLSLIPAWRPPLRRLAAAILIRRLPDLFRYVAGQLLEYS